jgi:CBS domain-containing protein
MRVDALRSVTESRLVLIPEDGTLRSAAQAFSNKRTGLLVVCDEQGRAAGVVSKSDIIRHLGDVGVTDAPVANLMIRTVWSCHPDDDLYATWRRMSGQGLQNMPVLGSDAKAVGVLDIRDLLKALVEREEHDEQLLINYVSGVGYQ